MRFSQKRESRLNHAKGGAHFPPIRGQPRREPKECSEQLVGTIKQVETHKDDPIDGPELESGSETDPWDKMAEQVSSLGRKLKDTYQRSIADEGPDQTEIKAALRTLGNAWEKVAQAVGAAARDEAVRANMKNAATGFFEAVGAAFAELGSELRRSSSDEEPHSRDSIVDGDRTTATDVQNDDDSDTSGDEDR